jgi:hypothetical protein
MTMEPVSAGNYACRSLDQTSEFFIEIGETMKDLGLAGITIASIGGLSSLAMAAFPPTAAASAPTAAGSLVLGQVSAMELGGGHLVTFLGQGGEALHTAICKPAEPPR